MNNRAYQSCDLEELMADEKADRPGNRCSFGLAPGKDRLSFTLLVEFCLSMSERVRRDEKKTLTAVVCSFFHTLLAAGIVLVFALARCG